MAGDNVGMTVFGSTMAGGGVAASELAGDHLQRGGVISRYVLIERVGAGGMGVVWAAYDPELDRKLAIKLLRPRRGSEGRSEEARKRLLREAQAMARLSHPNVIPVHDVGEHDGQVFVAMEFVDGHTLGEWVRSVGRRRDARAIIDMFVQAGRGLAAAHAAGLVHRDFKPDNVLVGADGRARVTDFGLARSVEAETIDESEMAPTAELVDTAETGPRNSNSNSNGDSGRGLGSSPGLQAVLTRTGIMLGTPAYMAPEQFSAGSFDARSDQFSFCVALWEALYDQRPFAGQTLAELSEAVTTGKLREPPPDSRVPGSVTLALRRGLAVDPAARWPDLQSLLVELERDPSLGRRRMAVGGALAASLLAALAVGPALADRHHADESEVCPAADAKLEQIWDAQRRAAVQDNLRVNESSELVMQLLANLDHYAADWLAMHLDACEDTNVRRELSPAVLDKRMRCLDERRTALGAAVELLATGDPHELRDPLNLLAQLPLVDRCGDLTYLDAQLPVPDDRELAEKVEAVRVELAKQTAMIDIGQGRKAIPPLEQLLVRAEALGYAPLEAQVLTELGFAEAGKGEPKRVRERLEKAVVAAVRTGQDELAARAGTELIFVIGWGLEDMPSALSWAELVKAWNDRTNATPVARAYVLISEGLVLTRGGLPGTAKVLEGLAQLGIDESLTGIDELDAHEATAAIWGINFLGIAAIYSGDYARARELFQTGFEMRTRLVGGDDPSTGPFQFNWSQASFNLGDWADAARQHQGLLARMDMIELHSVELASLIPAWSVEQRIAYADALGEPPCDESVRAAMPVLASERIDVRAMLARAQRVCGDLEGAEASLAPLAPEQRYFAPDNILLWQESGNLHLAQGRLDEAAAEYQAALDWAHKVGRHEQLPVAEALTGLAEVAHARGQDDEAAAKLREALAIDDALRSDGHPASIRRLELLAEIDRAQAEQLRARAAALRERLRAELAGV